MTVDGPAGDDPGGRWASAGAGGSRAHAPEAAGTRVDGSGVGGSGVGGSGVEGSGGDRDGDGDGDGDGTGVDGAGTDGSGVAGTGLEEDGVEEAGSGLDGSGLDPSGLDGSGPDRSGADASGAQRVDHVSTAAELPAAPGHARDLSRRRSTRRHYVDTGRRHHLGAAPAAMPVWGADGAIVGTTRTSPHQLASLTAHQLADLAGVIEAEMAAAAGDLDYERASTCRDEGNAVAAEIARRSAT